MFYPHPQDQRLPPGIPRCRRFRTGSGRRPYGADQPPHRRQQYQFHPIELANALLQNMPKVRCFEHTQILKYDTNITLYTPNHTITCQQVIFTTHSPSMFNEYFLFSRNKTYSSYILAKPYAYNKPFSALSLDQPSISLRTIDYNQDKYLLICNEDHRFGVHNT